MMNMHSPSFTAEELKEALKKIKEGIHDAVDTKQVCSYQLISYHFPLMLIEVFF